MSAPDASEILSPRRRCLGLRKQCGGRRELSPTSRPSFISPILRSSAGMCPHLPLAGPAALSAPHRAACVSQKRKPKHAWPAPGLSALAWNEVQLACLAHSRPHFLTASPGLVGRMIVFEHGWLGGKHRCKAWVCRLTLPRWSGLGRRRGGKRRAQWIAILIR